MVARPRLSRLLSRSAAAAVTLLSAGAGCGKTLAAAGWLAGGADGRCAAWLTLDETDNDPATFWYDVLLALQVADAVPAGSQLGLGAVTRPSVLVLDDVHELREPAALDALGRLVEHRGPALRLVLATRADPAIRLHRLRVSGRLAEIRADALAFDAAEARQLFARHGLRLTTPQLRALLERTQGWAVGLRLAAMSVDPADVGGGIAGFTGDQPPVADYLAAEVLDRHPPEVQEFLLRTSVAERISGALADTLTDGTRGRHTLERLAGDDGLVVALDRRREWYRYHPLLRQMLHHRLSTDNPPLAAEMERRQAIWYGQHGAPVEAVRRASVARDWDLVARLLVDAALPRLLSPEAPALVAAVQPVAEQALRDPSMARLICSAAVRFHRHEYAAMDRDVGDARRRLGSVPADLRVSADVALTVFEAAAARARGRPSDLVGAGAHALALLEHAAAPDFAAAPEYRVIVLNGLGIGHLWCGHRQEANEYLLAAAGEAERLDFELPYVSALSHLAVADAVHGELDTAAERARHAVALAERHPPALPANTSAAYLSLALVHLQRAEWRDAGRAIALAAAASDDESDRSARLAVAAIQMRLLVEEGHTGQALAIGARLREQMLAGDAYTGLLAGWVVAAEAEALVAAGRLPAVLDGPAPGGRAQLCVARARLVAGQSGQAETMARALAGDPAADLETSVEARVLLALIAEHRRHDHAAVEALTEALALAEPEHVRRPFLILRDRLGALLRRQQQLVGGSADFVEDLLAHLVPPDGPAGSPLAEPLTDRELIVLRYLPTLRSNSEIGEDLFVTVNTVKAHLKSLYRKLGVANRRDAVRRGRALGFL
ncbi:transcriptional regulator [Phytohabitans rumicis]|uniref:Transcriptional regulator n=1 Tax=Phytohabitans rumicis TaxID=1076125 RepID=A0A6V8LM58_9ACTN|nr:transcriptional regulator [Phytohabitans rumicis]